MTQAASGPAFPTVRRTAKKLTRVEGMTLRDYFAAKAVQGLIASPRPLASSSGTTDVQYAEAAYLVADAMLKRRQA